MSDSFAVLNQINLVVRSMDATLAFYRALGLNIPESTVWRTATGAHHAEVQMSNGVFLSPAAVKLTHAPL